MILGFLVCLVLSGCGVTSQSAEHPLPVPSLIPTRPVTPPSIPETFEPGVSQPGDTGWIDAGPGVALRRMRVFQNDGITPVFVVRLDPTQVRFHVGYAPDEPRSLATWHKESGALVTINGGFFDENNHSTALVISGGTVSGNSYEGQGGMFAVDTAGNVSLRYLAEQPYDPGEPLVEALQSWPMFIKPGGTLVYTGSADEQPARRSAIALDTSGHVLLIVCTGSAFTLRGLADWLLASDLAIDAALNLDGGSSTGLYLDSGEHRERIDAFATLPMVLLVLPQ